jgi:hypothetical protein
MANHSPWGKLRTPDMVGVLNPERVRSRLSDGRRLVVTPEARTTVALVEAKGRGLIDQRSEE